MPYVWSNCENEEIWFSDWDDEQDEWECLECGADNEDPAGYCRFCDQEDEE